METHAPITLTDDQRNELLRRTRSRRARAEDVRRAQVILMLAAGEPYSAIQDAVGCFPSYISRWKERFVREGLAGLGARDRGQPRGGQGSGPGPACSRIGFGAIWPRRPPTSRRKPPTSLGST